MTVRSALAVLSCPLVVLVGVLALVATTGTAEAATCRVITYYKDRAETQNSGVWSNCPGQKGLRGKRTRYYTVETVQIGGPRTPPKSGMPCEFTPKGCPNLPVPR